VLAFADDYVLKSLTEGVYSLDLVSGGDSGEGQLLVVIAAGGSAA
jgi:hypothetical protein